MTKINIFLNKPSNGLLKKPRGCPLGRPENVSHTKNRVSLPIEKENDWALIAD